METISYKIKNKIKIGIVGSGDISEEYIKIINFFGHTVLKIVTKTKSKKNILFCKKHKIKHHYLDFDKSIKSGPKVDGWIICSSWDSLKENLLISIKHDIPILIEKSIIISSNDLLKIKSKLKKNQLRKISIGYNRNYYDFIPYLIKKIKKEGLNVISANLPEDYKNIIQRRGKRIKSHLTKYITSHWIALIYNILKNINAKIILKNKNQYYKKNILKSNTIIFDVKKSNKKIPLIINILPNNPMNINISFFSEKVSCVLSPIEKLEIFNGIKIVKNMKKQNKYVPQKKSFFVDNTYKPGFKLQYFDFVNSCILRNKKSLSMTNIDDLVEIYKMCEKIQNN
jgi:hypothetical protein